MLATRSCTSSTVPAGQISDCNADCDVEAQRCVGRRVSATRLPPCLPRLSSPSPPACLASRRIVAAWMKRVTAQNAAQPHPTAAPGAVFLHRLNEIGTARRLEAATAPEQRTQHDLVGTHEQDQQPAESGEPSRVAARSWGRAPQLAMEPMHESGE